VCFGFDQTHSQRGRRGSGLEGLAPPSMWVADALFLCGSWVSCYQMLRSGQNVVIHIYYFSRSVCILAVSISQPCLYFRGVWAEGLLLGQNWSLRCDLVSLKCLKKRRVLKTNYYFFDILRAYCLNNAHKCTFYMNYNAQATMKAFWKYQAPVFSVTEITGIALKIVCYVRIAQNCAYMGWWVLFESL